MRKKTKFKIGDEVRISKFKHTFEKGYTYLTGQQKYLQLVK